MQVNRKAKTRNLTNKVHLKKMKNKSNLLIKKPRMKMQRKEKMEMEAQKVILTEKIMIQAKYKQVALKNVLTNCAILKKYIKKYAQRYRPKDTDSYVKIVTIIM